MPRFKKENMLTRCKGGERISWKEPTFRFFYQKISGELPVKLYLKEKKGEKN